MQKTIAFIGAGNMASSLIAGLVADGYSPERICVTSPSLSKLEKLQQELKVQITQDNQQATASADVIILAVKPQKLQTVATELRPAIGKKLIISVVAGVSIKQLKTWLNTDHTPIVRCMPNTPALVRAGVTGMYAEAPVRLTEKSLAESIMQAVGAITWVEKEEQIDIVAALSGSGPAYFFKVMEVLQAGAVKLGLSLEQANMLTLQTALGATKMVTVSKKSLEELRAQVTSPGGMTAKAIEVLEQGGIEQLFYTALCAGQKRAQEIAKELAQSTKEE